LDGTNQRVLYDKDINLVDGISLQLGNSQDLKIYHHSSHSYIDSIGAGNLYIKQSVDDGDMIFQCDDGSGGVATYLTLDGGIASILTYRDILMANDGNDGKIKFGASQDLQIYHDGTYNVIKAMSGHMIIKQDSDDQDIYFQCDDGSGGTTTYLTLDGGDGNIKFYKDISNQANANLVMGGGQIKFADAGRLYIGDSNDLQIYHDGSNSYITSATGNLYIDNGANDADIIFKGTDATADITALTLDMSAAGKAIFNSSISIPDAGLAFFGTGGDLQINHDGSNSYVNHVGTGNMIIQNTTDDKDIIFKSDDGSGSATAYLTLDGSAGTIEVAKEMNLTVPLATDQQKHLAWFEIAGFGTGDGTNYEISVNLDNDTAPFSHNVSTGADGTTAITVQNIMRSGGTVIPQAGTIKRWKGWATTAGTSTANVALFKITPARNDNSDVAPVLIDNVSYTAVGNAKMLDFDETSFTDASVAAGDIVVTGIKCEDTKTTYFGSTLEIEF